MMKRELEQYQRTIMCSVRPATVPVGVCLLESERDIPGETYIVASERNVIPAICQLISMARHEERMVGALRPEMSCALGMSLLGMIDLGEDGNASGAKFLAGEPLGKISQGLYTENREKGALLEAGTFSIPGDRFKVLVVAPLSLLSIPPTLVLQFCNPTQIVKLVRGYVWKTGKAVEMSCSGRVGLCSEGIARAFIEGRPVCSIPTGDRPLGLVRMDEMVFAIPFEQMPLLMEGLEAQKDSPFFKYPPVPYAGHHFQLHLGIVPRVGRMYERALAKAKKRYQVTDRL